ncbi:MAG TPA: FtsX-like permease family protein [Actinomycetota bacterium]|nr:FtsX-like permease family protein [Actinomycetota bacterium]
MTGTRLLLRTINVRHLLGRRVRTALTVGGVAAGVALVFSISVINLTLIDSFRASIREVAGAAEIEVAAPDAGGFPSAFVERIESVAGIDNAVPVVRSVTTASTDEVTERVEVLGITPEFTSLFPEGGSEEGPAVSIEGDFGPRGEGIILAGPLADALGIKNGEALRVQTPRGERAVTVTGVVEGAAVDLVNGGSAGVMLLPAAQSLFDKGDNIDSIYVVVDPTVSPEDAGAAIDEVLEGSAVIGPPGERGRGLERVFGGLATLLSLSGTVSLFVSLFVVYNTMAMALAERRKEISMVLALGADRRSVFGAFICEAALLGTVAAVLGIGGGYLLARVLIERAIEGFQVLPLGAAGALRVVPSQVVLAFGSGVAVAVAGAFVPARRVLNVPAIDALRPEASYEFAASRAPGWFIPAGIGVLLVSVVILPIALTTQLRLLATLGLVAGLAGVSFLLPSIVPLVVRAARPVLSKAFGPVGRLAADSLDRSPGRTTFTVAALVLTLGLVLCVGSALRSYSTQVEDTASALVGAPVYITAESFSGLGSDQPLPLSFAEKLERLPGVSFVYPIRFSFVTIDGDQGLIYAVPGEEALNRGSETSIEAITETPEEFIEGLGRGEIAISNLMARHRGLAAGDELALPTPEGSKSFRIAAIFNDLVSFDSIYIDHGVYASLWNDDKADEFGLLLEDGADPREVKERAEELIATEGLTAVALEKDELIGRIIEVVEGTFSLGQGIQFAALVVALLTIANTMFTAVLERRWELGLERAIGMSGRQVAIEVLLEAVTIGVIGGFGGALLGSASGWVMTQSMEAQFEWSIAFDLPIVLGAGVVLLGTVIAALAGVVPSRLALRASVIDSLRFE